VDLGHNLNLIEKYEKLVRKNGDIIFLQGKYFQKTVQPVAKLTFETNGKTLAPPTNGRNEVASFASTACEPWIANS